MRGFPELVEPLRGEAQRRGIGQADGPPALVGPGRMGGGFREAAQAGGDRGRSVHGVGLGERIDGFDLEPEASHEVGRSGQVRRFEESPPGSAGAAFGRERSLNTTRLGGDLGASAASAAALHDSSRAITVAMESGRSSGDLAIIFWNASSSARGASGRPARRAGAGRSWCAINRFINVSPSNGSRPVIRK